jgi:hypothetical protein
MLRYWGENQSFALLLLTLAEKLVYESHFDGGVDKGIRYLPVSIAF